jgi:two-component system cell cycle sensor histidine kinase/response regulator CckA
MELTLLEGSVVASIGLLLALAAIAPAWWMKTILGRRLREEIQEHSDTVARIESSAADAMLTIDEFGLVRSFNKSAESIFGYGSQEILGRSIGTLIPAAANSSSSGYGLNSLNAARRTPNGIGVEVMGLRKNGTSMPLDLRLTATVQSGVRLFHAVIRDLSDRITAEKHARDAEFLDGLLQSVGAPVVVLDKEGKVVRHNRAFAEWSGYVDPEGRHYWELLLPADDWSRAKVTVAQVIAGGSCQKGAALWRKRNGDTASMLLAMTALRAGNAAAESAVVVGFEAPASQLDHETGSEATMDAVERLAGGIAKQFNDLLTSINGYSELVLHSMGEQDPLRRDVEQIRKAGERATALTSQLLAFSRKQPMKASLFNLNTLIGGMKQTLEVLLGDRIQVSTILDLELGRMKADEGWIEQVILNLAVNARDAMPDGGKLTIETANIDLDTVSARKTAQLPPGEYVVLSVSDTGIGIDPSVRQHLFEPFSTTKRAGKGLGLGLSTVYGVVRQSGGNVVVQSIPGSGTSVRVFFPRHAEGDQPEKAAKGLFLVRGAGGH